MIPKNNEHWKKYFKNDNSMYLPLAWGRTDGFMPFLEVLVQSEMQTVLFKI